ncbi:MAG TPA: TadE/TadG family type IV pilus assembly protein [Acidimicrobiia bacterium]|nr:TadE/TadG family type IV pilus assembly protein [Acidimicrobiia bacterium]
MRSQRGSLSLELVLIVPVFIALVTFIAGAATLGRARATVDDAAWEAARAASFARSAASAEAAGRAAVDRRLAGERWPCLTQRVDIDLSRFRPGGDVTVAVACDVRLRDTGLFLPGATHVTARAVAPLDQYKAMDQ